MVAPLSNQGLNPRLRTSPRRFRSSLIRKPCRSGESASSATPAIKQRQQAAPPAVSASVPGSETAASPGADTVPPPAWLASASLPTWLPSATEGANSEASPTVKLEPSAMPTVLHVQRALRHNRRRHIALHIRHQHQLAGTVQQQRPAANRHRRAVAFPRAVTRWNRPAGSWPPTMCSRPGSCRSSAYRRR